MNFYNKEYIKYNQENTSWKNGLFHATGILIILFLFQPFDLSDKDLKSKLLLYPGYALIAFFYNTAKFYLIRRILKSKTTWTLKKEIISLIAGMFPLALIIHFYSFWATVDMPFNIYWYLRLLYYTTSLYLLITILEYFYYSNRSADIQIEQLFSKIQLYSKQLETAKKENSRETIPISLEKGKLTVNRDKIIFIESKGNYLVFCFREKDGAIKKLMKRGRLHQVETDLENYMEFFRCHRAFIINLKKTQQIKGNSKNARLILENELEEIPVSRTYFKTLTQKLETITTV